MSEEEYKYHINLTQSRYQHLNLSFEQAEKVFKFENEKDSYIGLEYSTWEEWDFELTFFSAILSSEQLKNYENDIFEVKGRYIERLKEDDKSSIKDIEYYQRLIEFYENQFLPDLLKTPYIPMRKWLFDDESKVDYICEEYRKFLSNEKSSLLTYHFRHYRSYKPNKLKATLLEHKLLYLFPDYKLFSKEMDTPTKAVGLYFFDKLEYIPDYIDKVLNEKYNALNKFQKSIRQEKQNTGWLVHFESNTKDEDRVRYTNMNLLLLDREKYGVDDMLF